MIEKRLEKVVTVESERFVVEIYIDEKGRLGIEVGSEDGSGISRVETETNSPVVRQKFSSGFLEDKIDSECDSK